jgi:hypothetical protein
MFMALPKTLISLQLVSAMVVVPRRPPSGPARRRTTRPFGSIQTVTGSGRRRSANALRSSAITRRCAPVAAVYARERLTETVVLRQRKVVDHLHTLRRGRDGTPRDLVQQELRIERFDLRDER